MDGIDRAFISNLEFNAQSAAIVRAIIGLGHGLSMPLLAEGVETELQRTMLAREGCEKFRAISIGRPGPIQDYALLAHDAVTRLKASGGLTGRAREARLTRAFNRPPASAGVDQRAQFPRRCDGQAAGPSPADIGGGRPLT